MRTDFYFVTFVGVLVLIIIEMILSGRWVPWYFRSGVPLFRRRLSWEGAVDLPSVDMLEAFGRAEWGPDLVFRQTDEYEISFRERAFQFTLLQYTPIMHGRIVLLREENRLLVEGRTNWFALAFCAFLLLQLSMIGWRVGSPFALALVGMMSLLYAVQASRYWRLAKAISSGRKIILECI